MKRSDLGRVSDEWDKGRETIKKGKREEGAA